MNYDEYLVCPACNKKMMGPESKKCFSCNYKEPLDANYELSNININRIEKLPATEDILRSS